ncbi:MAG: AzlD domain-containing protein [Actinomycetota bacterium]
MTTWIVIAVIGAVSYCFRVSMFVILAGRTVPASWERPMSVVGPAAITALLATMLFTTRGQFDPVDIGRLAAVAVGFLVVRRTGNVMHAFAAGFPVFWAIDLLV